MKEAMWGVGLIFISMFGIFLVSIFGNISVTNQQDYTAMTNTVEAAMNDAKDIAHFRSGFCICTSKKKVNNKWVFESSSEYEIAEPTKEKCPTKNGKTCELVQNEYKIDKKVFAESLLRRFSQSVKENNDYKLIVQDVIEYPPKVSVLVQAKAENNYNAVGGDYYITNQIDAVLESYPSIWPTPTLSPTPKPTKTPKPTAKPTSAPKPTTKPTTKPSTSKPKATATPKPKMHTCFLEGTKVVTASGYRDIDKLFIGEKVLTYNEKTKKNEYKSVLHTFKFEDAHEELYTIKIDDNTEFSLTGYHRVYAYRDGEYKYILANELVVGDIVRYSSGEEHTITDISYETINKTVYNLETEDNHNFYVGNQGVLVHNMGTIRFYGQDVDKKSKD